MAGGVRLRCRSERNAGAFARAAGKSLRNMTVTVGLFHAPAAETPAVCGGKRAPETVCGRGRTGCIPEAGAKLTCRIKRCFT